MKRSRLDEVFQKASLDLSQRVSRRRLLGFVGKATMSGTFLGLLGGRLMAAFTEAPQQQPPCEPANAQCAMNGKPCAPFGNSSPGVDCSTCLQQGGDNSGCPAGSVKGGSWIGCCPCKDDATRGREITYKDCCGPLDRTRCPKGCNPGSRVWPAVIGRKPPTIPKRGSTPVFGNCYAPGGSWSNWCKSWDPDVPTLGETQCTQVEMGDRCCQPMNPSQDCQQS